MTARPDTVSDVDLTRPGDPFTALQRGPNRPLSRRGDPLPELGDWDGPIFGELGVLAVDEDGKVACHACGRAYHLLGNHVRNAHDLLPEEYRALFGLRMTTGLASPRVKDHGHCMAIQNFRPFWKDAGEHLAQASREQTTLHAHAGRLRLESRRDPKNRANSDSAGKLLSAWTRAQIAAGTWQPPRPHDPHSAGVKGSTGMRVRLEDPEFRARWAAKIAAAHPPKELTCQLCGTSYTRSRDWTGRHYCGSACATEARRQRARAVNAAARPEVAAKIIVAARSRRGGTHKTVAQRLATLDARAFAALSELEQAVIRLYFGLEGGQPLSKRALTVRLGVTDWRIRRILQQSVARLLDSAPSDERPVRVCQGCGQVFAANGRQHFCSQGCRLRTWNERRRGERICASCGQSFEGPAEARYCSLACAAQGRRPVWRDRVSAAARQRGRKIVAPLVDDPAFTALPARDQEIVRRYYGLDGGSPATCDEIALLLEVEPCQVANAVKRTLDTFRRRLPTRRSS